MEFDFDFTSIQIGRREDASRFESSAVRQWHAGAPSLVRCPFPLVKALSSRLSQSLTSISLTSYFSSCMINFSAYNNLYDKELSV